MSLPAFRPGASMDGSCTEQISQSMDTWRNVTIQISNHSQRFTLENPKVHTDRGYCFRPPQPTIKQNTSEVCAFSKRARIPRGCFGVLTYQILTDEKNCEGELVIMFSVPFDLNLFDNCFALGIYEPNTACGEDLLYQMYYDTGLFTKSRGTGSTITHSREDFTVKGTMSSGGQSVMKVEFWDV